MVVEHLPAVHLADVAFGSPAFLQVASVATWSVLPATTDLIQSPDSQEAPLLFLHTSLLRALCGQWVSSARYRHHVFAALLVLCVSTLYCIGQAGPDKGSILIT